MGRLEEFSFFDLLGELWWCADRSQFRLRSRGGGLRLDRVRTCAVWQEFSFLALCQLACLRRASIIDITAPAGAFPNTEFVLGALEEHARIEAQFRRGRVVVRRTRHHLNDLQKGIQARAMRS